jgi:hypothetical protein
VVRPDGSSFPFEIDPTRKTNLLQGLDKIGLTLAHAGAIAAFEASARGTRFMKHGVSDRRMGGFVSLQNVIEMLETRFLTLGDDNQCKT